MVDTEYYPERIEKLNLAKIFAFYRLVRFGSFQDMSRESNIPIYKIHNDLNALEKTLGKSLIARGHKKLTLTEFGKNFSKYCRDTYENFYGIESLFKEGRLIDSLVVATTHGIAQHILPNLLVEFAKIYPHVNFKVLTGMNYLDFDMTQCDLSIGPPITNRTDLSQFLLKKYHYTFYASKNYLDTRGWPKGIEGFKNHDLLIFNGYFPLPRDLEHQVNVKVESTIYDLLVRLAERDQGIVSLPEELAEMQPHTLVRVLPDYCETEEMVVSFKKNSFRLDLYLEFKNVLSQMLKQNSAFH